MKLVIAAIICYFIGCINPAYMIGKAKGFDIRSRGSMNAGASNVMINVGKKAGVFTAILDILKSFFCYKMAAKLFPMYAAAAMICAACCVLGHIFPFYLKFKGGKGFACLGGVVLGFNFKVFFIMLFCAFLLVLVIKYLCLITTLTALSFPVIYYGMSGDYIGAIIILLIGLIIISKHIPNFIRISNGTEARFSGIWNREEEEERIRVNTEKLEQKKRG